MNQLAVIYWLQQEPGDAELNAFGAIADSVAVGIERRRAESQLDQFKATLDQTHDSIFIIDGGMPSLKQAERGKVVELDATGRVLDTFGSYGSDPGQFRLGHDIAVGPDGAVYTVEGTGERVQKFVRRKF